MPQDVNSAAPERVSAIGVKLQLVSSRSVTGGSVAYKTQTDAPLGRCWRRPLYSFNCCCTIDRCPCCCSTSQQKKTRVCDERQCGRSWRIISNPSCVKHRSFL
uniref:(northern house mosquito) hypothetical protein n=1 Tax=Culex pipiens TaxID=7175 RepID=A0A8D8DRY7_CULPI